jgi:nitrogen fixation NifU-like protein
MPPSDGAHSPPSHLTALYQELILDHYRRPRNRGTLEHPDVTVTKKNPLCGDALELQLALDGDTVREVRFTGQGCAISQASASMMTQILKGKSIAEVQRIADRFDDMIHGDEEAAADKSLGDLRALAGVAKLPIREKCALLAWGAVREAVASR